MIAHGCIWLVNAMLKSKSKVSPAPRLLRLLEAKDVYSLHMRALATSGKSHGKYLAKSSRSSRSPHETQDLALWPCGPPSLAKCRETCSFEMDSVVKLPDAEFKSLWCFKGFHKGPTFAWTTIPWAWTWISPKLMVYNLRGRLEMDLSGNSIRIE